MGKIFTKVYSKSKKSKTKHIVSSLIYTDELDLIRLSALAENIPYTAMIRKITTLWKESEEEKEEQLFDKVAEKIQKHWCYNRGEYKDFEAFKKETDLELYELNIPKKYREQIIKKIKAYD